MKPVAPLHLLVAILITAALSTLLGFAVEDSPPVVVFVSTLGLGSLAVFVFCAIERRY